VQLQADRCGKDISIETDHAQIGGQAQISDTFAMRRPDCPRDLAHVIPGLIERDRQIERQP
jgi:hypothetical protein